MVSGNLSNVREKHSFNIYNFDIWLEKNIKEFGKVSGGFVIITLYFDMFLTFESNCFLFQFQTLKIYVGKVSHFQNISWES